MTVQDWLSAAVFALALAVLATNVQLLRQRQRFHQEVTSLATEIMRRMDEMLTRVAPAAAPEPIEDWSGAVVTLFHGGPFAETHRYVHELPTAAQDSGYFPLNLTDPDTDKIWRGHYQQEASATGGDWDWIDT